MPSRSEILETIFPTNMLIEIFGTGTPSREKLTQYFDSKWREWADAEVIVSLDRKGFSKGLRVLRSQGLKQFWDYQFKITEHHKKDTVSVRFKTSYDAAFFRIAFGN